MERRKSEKHLADLIAAADAEIADTDTRVLRGDFGDKPGERGYEAHRARADRRAEKEESDGKR